MKIQILRPHDDWEALYIDGKLVVENHSLSAEDVGNVIATDVEVFDVFDFEEDDPDFELDRDGNDIDYYKGKPIWINGEGCPKKWPL